MKKHLKYVTIKKLKNTNKNSTQKRLNKEHNFIGIKSMENRNKELHFIFEGIANKDEKEFNKLYEKYKSLVYAIVFSMLKNQEDSEEVVQIIFTKIWNMKKENLPTSNETAWLYNVSRNETINYLRKQKHKINIDDLYYINEENKELENIIDAEYYNNILSKLNTKEKEIVSLKILSSLSFKEIAQILNIPIGTVQWKYYKSLHTLKMLMGNLTMFMLTFTLYIKQKASIKKLEQKNEENLKGKNEEKQTQVSSQENTSNDRTSSTTRQNTIEDNTSKENTTDEQKSSIRQENAIKDSPESKEENETKDLPVNQVEDIAEPEINQSKTESGILNKTIENVIATREENMKQQKTMLLCISSIFLTITIVFFAISIKQKRHKSTK